MAPTPTNISTKSEPEMVKNGTLASPAMARASSVLPVPGGPTSSTPFGILPPRRWNFCGSFRNSTISSSSCLASSMPATSSKVMRPVFSVSSRARRLAEAHGAAAAALHLAHEEDPHADQQQHREPGDQDAEQRRHVLVGRRGVDLHALVDQPRRRGWDRSAHRSRSVRPSVNLPLIVLPWIVTSRTWPRFTSLMKSE